MNGAFSSIERSSIVVCCALSLLLFFFPLLTIKVPIAGDQGVSGYDVLSKVNQFRENLKPSGLPSTDKTPSSSDLPPSDKILSSSPHTANPGAPGTPDLPLSVELSWLIPVCIAVAFLSAAVALLGAFRSAKVARAACTVGACSSGVAILHIMVMNSDIHSWFSASMRVQQADLKDNPFAGFAEGLGNLVANAFQLKPGWGLYSLLVLLGVAAVLGFSRLLSRLQIAPSPPKS